MSTNAQLSEKILRALDDLPFDLFCDPDQRRKTIEAILNEDGIEDLPVLPNICPRCHQYFTEEEAGVTTQQCHNCDLAGGMYHPRED